MHTAYTYDPTHVGHVHANHPEKPQRAHLAFNTLERDGILGTLACLDPVPNPEAAITRALLGLAQEVIVVLRVHAR
ncbi:MAG: hypothetical protein AAFP15_19075, partial [Bacteroidota bacterium]